MTRPMRSGSPVHRPELLAVRDHRTKSNEHRGRSTFSPGWRSNQSRTGVNAVDEHTATSIRHYVGQGAVDTDIDLRQASTSPIPRPDNVSRQSPLLLAMRSPLGATGANLRAPAAEYAHCIIAAPRRTAGELSVGCARLRGCIHQSGISNRCRQRCFYYERNCNCHI